MNRFEYYKLHDITTYNTFRKLLSHAIHLTRLSSTDRLTGEHELADRIHMNRIEERETK